MISSLPGRNENILDGKVKGKSKKAKGRSQTIFINSWLPHTFTFYLLPFTLPRLTFVSARP
jgi:hypothetical protein